MKCEAKQQKTTKLFILVRSQALLSQNIARGQRRVASSKVLITTKLLNQQSRIEEFKEYVAEIC